MKKLHLLSPEIKTVYMKEGKGQRVDYLKVNNRLSQESLQRDVKNGAAKYRNLLGYLQEEQDSRFIIIKAPSREEGLTAVSYLAAIFNKIDGKDDSCAEGPTFEDMASEAVETEYEDFGPGLPFGDESEEDDSENADDNEYWEESANLIPLIEYEDVNRYTGNNTFGFGVGGFGMAGAFGSNGEKPYWMSVRKEMVCILANAHFMGLGENVSAGMKRFENNRRVFLVIVDEVENNSFDPDFFDDLFECHTNLMNELIYNLTLDYLASVVEIRSDKEEDKKYYLTAFENLAAEVDKKVGTSFPAKELIERVVQSKSSDKMETLRKLVRYINHKYPKAQTLNKTHYELIMKFKVFGIQEKKQTKSEAEVLEKELVGMDDVKHQINSIVRMMKYSKLRQSMGMPDPGYHNVHLLIGAPGTAKTTVAKLLGSIMAKENLLPGDNFISVNGADLKGLYVGHTAPKVHALFADHDIILIDEAYSIVTEGEDDSFSQEAIAQLILEIEEHATDKLIMFAGYGGRNVSLKDNRMKQFIDANPGLKSRINSTIFFDSYNADQMVQIVHAMAAGKGYKLGAEADAQLEQYFADRVTDSNFGNGREARSVLENTMRHAADRLMGEAEAKITKEQFSELTTADVMAALADMRAANANQKGVSRAGCGFLTA